MTASYEECKRKKFVLGKANAQSDNPLSLALTMNNHRRLPSSTLPFLFAIAFGVLANCGGDDGNDLFNPSQDAGNSTQPDASLAAADTGVPVSTDSGKDATPIDVNDAGELDADADAGGSVIGLDNRPTNTTCKAFTAPPPTGNVHLVDRFPNVVLNTPTGLSQRPGDNARWYALERGGVIKTFPNDPNVAATDVKVSLDLSAVTWTQWDCSLGSLAFPPDFATSKHAYVGYCYVGPDTGNKLQVRISRFASADGGLTFDKASEQVILALDHPGDAAHPEVGLHTSDAMHFGKDGYLYASIGDGGTQGKVGNPGGGLQAQDRNDLRGKLLRLDVHDLTKELVKDFVPNRQRTAVDIPPDNPFVGDLTAKPEVYAYGFRNPWQWQFDRTTNLIWLGDVGNSTWEEVDRDVQKGSNYGWAIYEGFNCTNYLPNLCNTPNLQAPLLNYHHGSADDQGNAITGGVVYRGTGVPSYTGSYIFGDSSTGHVWSVANVDGLVLTDPPPTKKLIFDGAPVSAFAQDQDGELFATILYNTGNYPKGKILMLEEAPALPDAGAPLMGGPPQLLSDTGCFQKADPKTPVDALVPYEPSAQLWSDGATKRRWLALPDGKQISVETDGDFTFPTGSVLVKEFSLGTTKVETRFFVRQDADDRWAAYTYRWNDDQLDAVLLDAGGAQGSYTNAALDGGTQLWNFPSRAQCHQCHTQVAGTTLGLEIAQLNHDIQYAATGRTANQLTTLSTLGMIANMPASPWANLANLSDTTRSDDDRARAYLHINCSICHRPDGPTFTPLDLRFEPTYKAMNVCDALPTIDNLAEFIPTNPRIIAPGDPSRSVLYWRLATDDTRVRMPPIARTLTDIPASTLISNWITATATCPP